MIWVKVRLGVRSSHLIWLQKMVLLPLVYFLYLKVTICED